MPRGEGTHREARRAISLPRLGILALTIAAGLGLRAFGPSLGMPVFVVKYGGSVLWGAMVYQIVAFPLREPVVSRSATIAIIVAASVEFFRLYHSPALDAFRLTIPGALLLGRVFAFADILAYAIGIAIAAGLDAACAGAASPPGRPAAAPVILFDGVCLLCLRCVQFVLRHERDESVRFVAIQSDEGRALAAAHGVSADDPDTFLFVADGRAYAKSRAAIEVLSRLRAPWPMARALRFIPTPLRNAVYDIVARNRYGWFGRSDVCMAPTPEQRRRFALPAAKRESS